MVIIVTLFLYLSKFIFSHSKNPIKYIFEEIIFIYEIHKNYRGDKK